MENRREKIEQDEQEATDGESEKEASDGGEESQKENTGSEEYSLRLLD